MKKTTELNSPGGIYVYDTSLDDGCASEDTSFNQLKTLTRIIISRSPLVVLMRF